MDSRGKKAVLWDFGTGTASIIVYALEGSDLNEYVGGGRQLI